MVKIFATGSLTPNTKLDSDQTSWVYNGLDCCVTLEVAEKLKADLEQEPENVKETYQTAMSKLPPVNFMCLRGLRRDEAAISQSLAEYRRELRGLEDRFNRIMEGVFEYTINWRSPLQLKNFFYGTLGLKPIRKRNANGVYAPTTNSEAMEKIQNYLYPKVFASYILAMRDLGKKISFLETKADPDGRMRTNLNIAGTDTGRFNSSFSNFGTGTNLQNVENRLRRGFISDPGYIFVNVDLEQADARGVGARLWETFYDEEGPEVAGKYLDTCESGDLHTRVCSMAWQELDWPDPWEPKLAREIADQISSGRLSYRGMSKKLGHGTNYYGQPNTMAKHTKTPEYIIADFQRRYFKAFPLIPRWHKWVQEQLDTQSALTTIFGRRRIFFGRASDANTLRAAIAYEPQSVTGEALDRGWLRLWDGMPEALLHIPVHDSILFQLPIEGLHELLPRALELLTVSLELKGGRIFTIPLEAKTGYNWGDAKYDKTKALWHNPNGLREWTGKEEREQPRVKTRLAHYLK